MIAEFWPNLAAKRLMEAVARPMASLTARRTHKIAFSAARLAKIATKPSKPRFEYTGEIVAERHQAPFAAHLVEAADQEVAIAGAAFERAEGMFDDGRTTAHQLACALHPRAVAFENIFVLPATDGSLKSLWGEATCP